MSGVTLLQTKGSFAILLAYAYHLDYIGIGFGTSRSHVSRTYCCVTYSQVQGYTASDFGRIRSLRERPLPNVHRNRAKVTQFVLWFIVAEDGMEPWTGTR